MTDFYSACRQCPRDCGTDRKSKTGFCGEHKDIRIASACLHFGEEPLITVFGGSGTIFFTGCTLGCSFCQNYQISQQGMGRKVSKDEFVRICLELQSAGAENINLVTASHLIPLLAEYLAEAKNDGVKIPFCWNSSAYEKIESLELLKNLVTVWLPDLKTLNGEVSRRLFKTQNYPEAAKDAILWMIKNNPLKIQTVSGIDRETKQKVTKEKITGGVIIRHLFLPGRFEDTADVLEWLKNNADKKAIISLMSQYTPVPFKETEENLKKRLASLSMIENRLVSKQEDYDLKDLIDAFDFDFLFYQDLTDDTQWLPDFNRVQPFSNALAKPVWHWKNSFNV